MKKRFTPVAALCSAMLLSSSLCAMDAAAIVEEAAPTEAEVSAEVVCKIFNTRMKESLPLLAETSIKVDALKTDGTEELTKEQQATQANVALIKEKLPVIISDLKSVRANIKFIAPDSMTESGSNKAAAVWNYFSSKAKDDEQEADIICTTSVAELEVVRLCIEEFMGHFALVKKSSNNEEVLQLIENTLNAVLANIKVVEDTVAPEPTLLANIVKSLKSHLSSIL